MEKLHSLVGATLQLIYTDNSNGFVIGTVSSERVSVLVGTAYVDKDIIVFHINKQYLIEENLPMKGFKEIIYNRER